MPPTNPGGKPPAPAPKLRSDSSSPTKAAPKKAAPKKAAPKTPVKAAPKTSQGVPAGQAQQDQNIINSGGNAGGSSDPFAGTPYAGMTPWQAAQKIVQDEYAPQIAALNQQEQQQASQNSYDVNNILGFGQALSQASSQFAPNMDKLLEQIGTSHQNFAQGYQDTYNMLSGQTAPLQPGQQPSWQAANPQGSSAAASSFINAAELSNPFSVLPAAYGRLAQMDATKLAATNSANLANTYGPALAQLLSGESADTLTQWQNFQSDAAASAAAASAAAAAQEKQYEWQYSQAASEAKFLTTATGTLYTVNPTTLAVVQAKDAKTGQPVVTVAGHSAGVKNTVAQQSLVLKQQIATANAQYRKATLAQRKASYQLQQQNADKLKPAASDVSKAAGYMMLFNPNTGQYTFALGPNGQKIKYKGTTAKTSTSPNVPGTPAFSANLRKQQTDQIGKASQRYASLLQATHISQHVSSKGATSESRSGPQYTSTQAKAIVGKQYLPTFIRIANAMLKNGLLNRKYTARQIADYWLNEATKP